jgi:DNA-binding transcriptional LysR family regulator
VALDWDDFRYLLALREQRSLGAAARALGVDPSTASRRLAALEDALGAQLVLRTPEGVRLTEAGQRACDVAAEFEKRCEALLADIGGRARLPEGTVRVSVTEGFAAVLYRWLVPIRERHPKITIELVVSNKSVDLLRHEADLGVRFFRDASPDLVVRKVGRVGWSLYAAESYVARKGVPSLADLRGHEIVGFADAALHSPGARWLARRSDVADVAFRGSSTAAVVNAVKAGLGVSLLPCFLVEDLAGLRRLTPNVLAFADVYLAMPPDHRDTVRVHAVADMLAALFASERDRLAGGPIDGAPADGP